MRAASRTLQRAALAAPAVEDGQESIKKLAYAPLGFLSLGGNVSYIASILASAVAFLEGHSAGNLETDVQLEQDSNGEYVAHTELKLVPYAFPRAGALTGTAQRLPPSTTTDAAITKLAHRFSMSQALSVRQADTSAAGELERFKRSFGSNGMMADLVANDILLTTDSVDVANTVLRYSAQVGLTISRSTLAELLSRMEAQDNSLTQTVFREFEFEMNLGMTAETSLFRPISPVVELPLLKRRKQSKLERLRSSRTRGMKP